MDQEFKVAKYTDFSFTNTKKNLIVFIKTIKGKEEQSHEYFKRAHIL